MIDIIKNIFSLITINIWLTVGFSIFGIYTVIQFTYEEYLKKNNDRDAYCQIRLMVLFWTAGLFSLTWPIATLVCIFAAILFLLVTYALPALGRIILNILEMTCKAPRIFRAYNKK